MSDSLPLADQDPVPPARRDLRALLVYAARWLVGRSAYHRGPLTVTIAEESGEKLVIRPKRADELYAAESRPALSDEPRGPSDAVGRLADRVFGALVSADGLAILRVIADRGTAAAKTVYAQTGIERSKCYTLIGDLRERGLIVDEGDGYEIGDRGLWDAIRDQADRRAG